MEHGQCERIVRFTALGNLFEAREFGRLRDARTDSCSLTDSLAAAPLLHLRSSLSLSPSLTCARIRRCRTHAYRAQGCAMTDRVLLVYENATFPRSHTQRPLLQIDSRYRPVKPVGRGAYGVVCSAFDTITQELVAVKRVSEALCNSLDAKRMLREVVLLRQLKHENIIGLKVSARHRVSSVVHARSTRRRT